MRNRQRRPVWRPAPVAPRRNIAHLLVLRTEEHIIGPKARNSRENRVFGPIMHPPKPQRPPASIASRPISLRPPAEMFHVKHLYGTRVSLSSMLLACDVLSNALKSATCDVRRIKKRFFRPCCRRSFPRSSKHYNLDQAFSKTNETVRKVVSSKTSHTVPFCAKAPSFSCANPDRVLFHVAECIRGASCVSRETSVRFLSSDDLLFQTFDLR